MIRYDKTREDSSSAEKIREPTRKTHRVVMVKTGPELQGWPTRRYRSFTAGLNLRTVQWMGPDTDSEIQKEFEQIFGCSCELSGDVFALANDDEILAEVNRRLRLRGLPLVDRLPTHPQVSFLLDQLPPGAKVRLQSYLASRAEAEGIGGAYICDVEQNKHVGKASHGPTFPSQLTHGTVVTAEHMRIFSPLSMLPRMASTCFLS